MNSTVHKVNSIGPIQPGGTTSGQLPAPFCFEKTGPNPADEILNCVITAVDNIGFNDGELTTVIDPSGIMSPTPDGTPGSGGGGVGVGIVGLSSPGAGVGVG